MQQQMQRDYDGGIPPAPEAGAARQAGGALRFPVPPGMVDLEFENIWAQYQAEREQGARQPEPTAAPRPPGDA